MSAAMADVHTYEQALRFHHLRGSNQLGRHTFLRRGRDYTGPDCFGVEYYKTLIVKFCIDKSIKLDSGGWKTSTTRDRIRHFVPSEYGYLKTNPSGWWWVYPCGRVRKFVDGMTLTADHKAPSICTVFPDTVPDCPTAVS